MKELMLYSHLDQLSAEWLIRELSWVGEDQVYSMRMYCPGGDVEATWGIIAKMQELKQKGCHSIAKVDGMAASMAGVLLCFFDEREALDVSNIMLHRAIMAERDSEGNPIEMTPEDIQYLAKVNSDLKTKLKQVINDGILKQLKGVTIDDLFNKKERINCWLNADEARQVGLVTKVVTLDASTSQYMAKAVAACYDPTQRPKATAATAGNNQTNAIKMTAEEFKKENPEAYAAIVKEAGEAAEKASKAKFLAALGVSEDGKGITTPPTVDPSVISAAVEATLKTMGITRIEGAQPGQTATATAKQAAEASEAEKKAKAEEDKKVEANLKAELDTIVTGGKK